MSQETTSPVSKSPLLQNKSIGKPQTSTPSVAVREPDKLYNRVTSPSPSPNIDQNSWPSQPPKPAPRNCKTVKRSHTITCADIRKPFQDELEPVSHVEIDPNKSFDNTCKDPELKSFSSKADGVVDKQMQDKSTREYIDNCINKNSGLEDVQDCVELVKEATLVPPSSESGLSILPRTTSKPHDPLGIALPHPVSNITCADIGSPFDFKHVSHVGFDPDTGFDIKCEDPELKEFFAKAGVSDKQLQDKDTREFVYNFINKYGRLVAVQDYVEPAKEVVPAPPSSELGPSVPPRTSSKSHRRPPRVKNITCADIGSPFEFKHVIHVGFDPENGFDITCEDPELKGYFAQAGVSDKQVQDKNTNENSRLKAAMQDCVEPAKKVSRIPPSPKSGPSVSPKRTSKPHAPPPPSVKNSTCGDIGSSFGSRDVSHVRFDLDKCFDITCEDSELKGYFAQAGVSVIQVQDKDTNKNSDIKAVMQDYVEPAKEVALIPPSSESGSSVSPKRTSKPQHAPPPPPVKNSTCGDIGSPFDFKHVSHIGFDPKNDFNITFEDPTLKAGVSDKLMQHKDTNKNSLLEAMQNYVEPVKEVAPATKSPESGPSVSPRGTSKPHDPVGITPPPVLNNNITCTDIGKPYEVRHVSHVEFDSDKGFDITCKDPQFKEFFTKAGVSDKQMQDKGTREYINNVINKNGGLEAVKDYVASVKKIAPEPPSSRSEASVFPREISQSYNRVTLPPFSNDGQKSCPSQLPKPAPRSKTVGYVSNIGIDPDKGFDITSEDFSKANKSNKQLQDKDTNKYTYNIFNKNGRLEVVQECVEPIAQIALAPSSPELRPSVLPRRSNKAHNRVTLPPFPSTVQKSSKPPKPTPRVSLSATPTNNTSHCNKETT